MNTRTYSLTCPPHLKAFSSPNYRRNQSRARHNGHYVSETHCCVVCGRAAVNAKEFALLSNVGEYITREEFEQHEKEVIARGSSPDDLGLYPVGSDCALKLKAYGIPLYSQSA